MVTWGQAFLKYSHMSVQNSFVVKGISVNLNVSKIFVKVSNYSTRETMEMSPSAWAHTINRSLIAPKFRGKTEPWGTKNGATSISTTDLNSAISKTLITAVSINLNGSDELVKKKWSCCEGILPNFDVLEIFAKVLDLYGKFDEKHDGDVIEHVQPTILKSCLNFMQKWSLVRPKMMPPQFGRRIPIWWPQ